MPAASSFDVMFPVPGHLAASQEIAVSKGRIRLIVDVIISNGVKQDLEIQMRLASIASHEAGDGGEISPALSPPTAIRPGSPPNSAACSAAQSVAAYASSAAAGYRCSGARR